MFIGQAIILGIIQGIAEFLPISSSGHLIIIPALFQWEDQGVLFDAFLHLGTLAAVLVYFRIEVKKLIGAWGVRSADSYLWRRLGVYILIATLPAIFFGLVFEDYIATALRSTTVVAISLIVWALVLVGAEYYSNKYSSTKKELTAISLLATWVIGLWQVIALIPGTSRSGITIIGGLFAGLDKEIAIKFSFLLSIPVIAGAGMLSVIELTQTTITIDSISPLIAGFMAAFFSGYVAIVTLINLVKRIGFLPFAVYRIILALGLLFFL